MKRLLIPALLCQAAALAFAQAPSPTTMGAAPITASNFVCGGVGDSEQQRMKAAAPGHDMMLTFATKTGAYLADVDVEIRNNKGELVVQGLCRGPLMLVDVVGNGTYEVKATSKGATQTRKVSVGSKLSRQVFTWPG